MLKDLFGSYLSNIGINKWDKKVADYEHDFSKNNAQYVFDLVKLREATNKTHEDRESSIMERIKSRNNLGLSAIAGSSVMMLATVILGEASTSIVSAYSCFTGAVLLGILYGLNKQRNILVNQIERNTDMLALLDVLEMKLDSEKDIDSVLEELADKTLYELTQEAKAQEQVDDIMRLYRTIARNIEKEQGATHSQDGSSVTKAEAFIVNSAVSPEDIIIPNDLDITEGSIEECKKGEIQGEQPLDSCVETNANGDKTLNADEVVLKEGDVIFRGVLDPNSVVITASERKKMEDFLFGETNEIETSDFMSR